MFPNTTSPADMVQIVTTTETSDDATRIAHHLLEKQLVACVQIDGPITSIYRWQGQVETASEFRCTIKARADRWLEVEQAIREVHAYEVPEIIGTRVDAVHQPYKEWLESVSSRPSEK